MKRLCSVLCALVLFAAIPAAADVVEPARTGQFGNPETVALRPYKWMWRGLRALVYHPLHELKEGSLRNPVTGSVDGLRGLRRGSVEAAESAFKGGVFAPVPEKGDYKVTRRANEVIESDVLLRNTSDFLFSWQYFPSQKRNQHWPAVKEDEIEQMKDEAAVTRKAREDARKKPVIEESRVKQAQRRYVPDRVALGDRKGLEGNLLRLAR